MTRELEARLKLTASDKTGKALASVSGKLDTVARKAAAVNRAQTMMGRASVAASRAMAVEAAVLARAAAPAALAVGGVAALRRFASTERALTRIAITADASDRVIASAGKSIRQIAQDVALPVDGVREGLETLVAAGKSLDEAMAMLPAVARTAQASDSALSDIASTAAAVGDSFKISAGEMQNAFDILAKGGKLGKFELPDMAQYLPSLAPQFATLGYKGEEGLTRLVALLQTVRMQTGEASEAATALGDLFGKMETDETQKRFLKFGINIRKELARVRRDGGDTIEAFIDAVDRALGGDLTKLPQLISDKESKRAVTALLQLRKEYDGFLKALGNVSGTVDADLERVLKNTQTAIDRLSNSFIALKETGGAALVALGADYDLNGLVNDLNGITAALTDIQQRSGGLVDKLGLGGKPRAPDDDSGLFGPNPRGMPGGIGAPGNIFLMDAFDAGKRFLFGELPPPLPLPAPARPAGPGGTAGDFASPLPRPRGTGAGDAARGGIGTPRRRGDGGRSTAGASDPVFAPAGMPLGDATLYGTGGFAPPFGGPAIGTFVADRPAPDLGSLPAVASDLVTTFGDLAAEARNFRTALAGDGPTSPPKAAPQLGELTDDELLAIFQGRVPAVDAPGARRPTGDATFGSTGTFRRDAEIDAIGEAADEAADKLRRLPEAVRPEALGAAGQQGGAAFVQAFEAHLTVGVATAVRNAFAAAEKEARAGAARLGAIGGSVKAKPAPVNADRGPSMSELGVP